MIETAQHCQVCGRPISATASTSRKMGPVCEEHVGFCLSPFVISVDSNENNPYHFLGIKEDASRGHATIIPRISTWAMWSKGFADYSIKGMENQVQVERKTKEDLYSTLGGRRSQFEAEIRRLNSFCEIAFVVVEAELSELLTVPPQRSKLNPKTVGRTIDSWMIKYPRVHWVLCCGRRFAELKTYRLLEMFWKKSQQDGSDNATSTDDSGRGF